ncbi:MAG: phage tail length tape measure family protein, partial [Prevotella sp.]|nr:phage tail length tape measure family protein [Prevotella sp.]
MADVITRLKIESGEYDSKIKRAVSGLQNMEQECRRVNGTLAKLEQDQKQYVQSLGQMQTVSNTVRGKIGELSGAFVELRAQYNRLTEEEKRGDYGKALSKSLDDLKNRIRDSKKELSDIQQELNGGTSKFGDFGKVIDTVGNRLGVSGSLTEMLTSKTAMMYAGIGAGIAVVGEATKAWMSYNAELAKQDQITKVTTGLEGPDSNRLTDAARAMADVYKVDFREAINAANTLMTQFGKTGDEAIQLLRDGMQGMVMGDGQKLLNMIKQYAPAFRDAGISASQLVAIIQNSEGGIFTDQNMNAIVMGIKNIRLMTNQTSEALAKLGIDGQDMTKKLNDGTMTIFDALKQVAGAITNVNS